MRSNNAEHLTARLAISETEKQQAYALRHEGYLAVGHIDARQGRVLNDEFDALESSRNILLFRGGVPAASARIRLMDPANQERGLTAIPACVIFNREISDLLSKSDRDNDLTRAVEVTRLARHPDFRFDQSLVFGMFRMIGYLILHLNVDTVFTAVCAKHIAFYRRLGFHEIAKPRDYPGLNNIKGALMACFRSSFEDIQRDNLVMNALSTNDDIYQGFIDGDLVSVYPSGHFA